MVASSGLEANGPFHKFNRQAHANTPRTPQNKLPATQPRRGHPTKIALMADWPFPLQPLVVQYNAPGWMPPSGLRHSRGVIPNPSPSASWTGLGLRRLMAVALRGQPTATSAPPKPMIKNLLSLTQPLPPYERIRVSLRTLTRVFSATFESIGLGPSVESPLIRMRCPGLGADLMVGSRRLLQL